MFLKIPCEGLRFIYLTPLSVIYSYLMLVSAFEAWGDFLNEKLWWTGVSEEAEAHRGVFESCGLLPSCVQGQMCLVFPVAGLLLGEKPSLLERLPHAATWIWQLFPHVRGHFPWALIPSTHIWQRRQRGARPHLWDSCFSSLWLWVTELPVFGGLSLVRDNIHSSLWRVRNNEWQWGAISYEWRDESDLKLTYF